MLTQPNPLPKYAQSGEVLAEGYVYRNRNWGPDYYFKTRQDAKWQVCSPNHGNLYETAKSALAANGKRAKVMAGADGYVKYTWDHQENCWAVETKTYDRATNSYEWEFRYFTEFEAVKVKMVVE